MHLRTCGLSTATPSLKAPGAVKDRTCVCSTDERIGFARSRRLAGRADDGVAVRQLRRSRQSGDGRAAPGRSARTLHRAARLAAVGVLFYLRTGATAHRLVVRAHRCLSAAGTRGRGLVADDRGHRTDRGIHLAAADASAAGPGRERGISGQLAPVCAAGAGDAARRRQWLDGDRPGNRTGSWNLLRRAARRPVRLAGVVPRVWPAVAHLAVAVVTLYAYRAARAAGELRAAAVVSGNARQGRGMGCVSL